MREAAPSLSAVHRRLKERGVNLNDMELPCQQIPPVWSVSAPPSPPDTAAYKSNHALIVSVGLRGLDANTCIH